MLEFATDRNTIEDSFETSRDRTDQKEFKLPKIERLTSRGQLKDQKQNMKLPMLRFQSMTEKSQDATDRKNYEDDDLVGHVQRRLKLILQEQNIIELEESDEEDDNFQRKINENKELIKKVKKRNQQIKKENELNFNLRGNPNMMKKFSQKVKNQHFQKRFRQYKQIHVQNKAMNKRKELASLNKNNLKEINRNNVDYQKQFISNKQISIKDGMKENYIKDIKSKDELGDISKIYSNASHKVAQKMEPKRLVNQFSQKNLGYGQKNELLFDVIHNYLQNPKKSQSQISNGVQPRKEKAELQQKLKQYEMKLQNLNNHPSQNIIKRLNTEEIEKDKQNIAIMSGSNNLKKIRINQRIIFDQSNSNFDRQIQRINHYAEKNERSLEKYVENQKLLYEVQMVSKNKLREKNCSLQKESS